MISHNHNDFRQEIFSKMKNHLISQNEKCRDPVTGRCKLRFNNLKCAASTLIPDSDYSEELENSSFYAFFSESGYSREELRLIEDVQLIHDYEEVSNWPKRLKEVATVWDMRYE